MGKGTISGETGEGLYSLDLDYGAARLQAEIDEATARSAALDGKINDALTAKLAASNAVSTQRGIVNAAINDYRDAIAADDGADEARDAVNAANKELLKLSVPLRVATAEHQNLANQKADAEARIAYLSGFNLTSTVAAWCADYTLGATGEVATIEVPGEPARVLIAPGAVAHAAADGEVKARVIQKSYQSFWNVAALPGWQKWMPTYRFASIDSIDRALNTCVLTLEAATSTAKGLNINQATALEDVPFDYLDCHHKAFLVGDEVVVRFESSDWAQPKVVGFKDNPKPCGTFLQYLVEHKEDLAVQNADHADSLSTVFIVGLHYSIDEDALKAEWDASFAATPDNTPALWPGLDIEMFVKVQGEAWVKLPNLTPSTDSFGFDLDYWGNHASSTISLGGDRDAGFDIRTVDFPGDRWLFGDGLRFRLGASQEYIDPTVPPPDSQKYYKSIAVPVEWYLRKASNKEKYFHVVTKGSVSQADPECSVYGISFAAPPSAFYFTVYGGAVAPTYSTIFSHWLTPMQYELSAPPP